MTLPKDLIAREGAWLGEPAPFNNVVVSTRARYARNLADHPFSPHAPASLLSRVHDEVAQAFEHNKLLGTFHSLEMTEATGMERAYLKEARLISKEMERGGANRAVYLGPNYRRSIMVNEEDHLRIQCLEAGLQISRAQACLEEMDEAISHSVSYAFHPKFGYLTACPTNVGTGLRVSVMMHLPGLATRRQVEPILQDLPAAGLTARGFHGENSENLGDFYQISNEVTLGRSVEQIETLLAEVVSGLMEREIEARSLLFSKEGIAVQDAIWRSFGLLQNARKMDTAEAMKLLSRVRLGVDEGLFPALTHEALNKLFIEVQPSHLVLRQGAPDDSESRDVARATLLRRSLGGGGE